MEQRNGAKDKTRCPTQGCLSESGHVRKSYWNRGNNRAEVWKTNTVDHGRDQWSADPVAPGLAEEEGFLTVAKILERAPRGITVVLRRGVSYAEILPKRLKVTDFISHNWAGTSKDLLEALRAAQVQNAWICTLAVFFVSVLFLMLQIYLWLL